MKLLILEFLISQHSLRPIAVKKATLAIAPFQGFNNFSLPTKGCTLGYCLHSCGDSASVAFFINILRLTAIPPHSLIKIVFYKVYMFLLFQSCLWSSTRNH